METLLCTPAESRFSVCSLYPQTWRHSGKGLRGEVGLGGGSSRLGQRELRKKVESEKPLRAELNALGNGSGVCKKVGYIRAEEHFSLLSYSPTPPLKGFIGSWSLVLPEIGLEIGPWIKVKWSHWGGCLASTSLGMVSSQKQRKQLCPTLWGHEEKVSVQSTVRAPWGLVRFSLQHCSEIHFCCWSRPACAVHHGTHSCMRRQRNLGHW